MVIAQSVRQQVTTVHIFEKLSMLTSNIETNATIIVYHKVLSYEIQSDIFYES